MNGLTSNTDLSFDLFWNENLNSRFSNFFFSQTNCLVNIYQNHGVEVMLKAQ